MQNCILTVWYTACLFLIKNMAHQYKNDSIGEKRKTYSWQKCDNGSKISFLSDGVSVDLILFAALRGEVGVNYIVDG